MTDNPSNEASSEPESESFLIEGFVADILNEREVVLNIGRENGVKPKMRFAILDVDFNYEIRDPKTGEVLGLLPSREKIRVEVVELAERLCIARTYQIRRTNFGGLGAGLGSTLYRSLNPPEYIEEPFTFRVEDARSYFKKISAEESIVKIGDHVIEVEE